ncbi:hypothetical protein IW140_003656 [Coemansia sp. RSA 1813]|nr:hypothetical protein EV178_002620 [Coemansia sp. RSA 1646]KAJ1770721.1 hypothetical protein LPJ74_002924 [Coemansia sp. RSA 1843]KAJ2088795.1 hypothetical protein IW138_003969 [Coemansia sp. RSA 986]KAJ2213731.1 hypothetical protein EV179_003631 [Coemansia sp. RSA 487]KAJ2568667.1 hypothetical protein IW140_003656 [Coemansia sp. RSA 1813]
MSTVIESPVPVVELERRATAYQQEILSANVRLTKGPTSRLQLQTIKPTGVKGDRLTGALVTFSFTAEPSDCNSWGSIHGGCVFTIFNVAGKIATAVVASGARNIVSSDLTTNYLAPVMAGSIATVEVECLRTTKAIGFLRSTIRDVKGTVCYICVQNVSFEM